MKEKFLKHLLKFYIIVSGVKIYSSDSPSTTIHDNQFTVKLSDDHSVDFFYNIKVLKYIKYRNYFYKRKLLKMHRINSIITTTDEEMMRFNNLTIQTNNIPTWFSEDMISHILIVIFTDVLKYHLERDHFRDFVS